MPPEPYPGFLEKNRHGPWIVAAVTIGVLLPFLGKAFHIDDPMFLYAARQIQGNPLDFYGFDVNWLGTSRPCHEVNYNPPLVSYLIAAAASIAGWSETALHAFFLIPAAGLGLGIHRLASRMCARPLYAAILGVVSPVFVISATNVMTDITMVCFYVWAVELWLRGLATDRHVHLAAASVLAGLAALTKYFGITAILLFLIAGFYERRRPGSWMLWLGVPVIVLLAYSRYFLHLYGVEPLSAASGYSAALSLRNPAGLFLRLGTGLSFTGGCFVFVLFLLPFLWPEKKMLVAQGALLAIGAALLVYTNPFGYKGSRADAGYLLVMIQLAVFILAGLSLFAIAAMDLARSFSSSSVLLSTWIMGCFVFSVFLNWSVNARTLLPMLPAAAILVARRLEFLQDVLQDVFQGVERPSWLPEHGVWIGVALTALLALAVGYRDYAWADSQRRAAETLVEEHGGKDGTVWFLGHWGFQYYMERNGARPWDMSASRPRPGDILIDPIYNSDTHEDFDSVLGWNPVPVAQTNSMPSAYLSTMAADAGSGFYMSLYGPLPYAFGRTSGDPYDIYVFR